MAPFLGANGFRVYCPDQPGFGWSDTAPEYIRRSKDHVDFIKMFVDALCLDKFYISGNSMGCSTLVNYVTAHPDRILGVAFIAGGLGDIVAAMAEMKAADPRLRTRGPRLRRHRDGMRGLMEASSTPGRDLAEDLDRDAYVRLASRQREAYTTRMPR